MTVTFTLSSLYTGATYVAGPFNIFAVTNTGASTQVGTGVTKAQLATGHTISGISDATTGGTINSTGTCTNSYPWYVSTPEPTATEPTVYTYNCSSGNCIPVEGVGGTYSTLEDCQANCTESLSYGCKESEFAPCLQQASPCGPGQTPCGEFVAPE